MHRCALAFGSSQGSCKYTAIAAAASTASVPVLLPFAPAFVQERRIAELESQLAESQQQLEAAQSNRTVTQEALDQASSGMRWCILGIPECQPRVVHSGVCPQRSQFMLWSSLASEVELAVACEVLWFVAFKLFQKEPAGTSHLYLLLLLLDRHAPFSNGRSRPQHEKSPSWHNVWRLQTGG